MIDYWDTLPSSLLASKEPHLQKLGQRIDRIKIINFDGKQAYNSLLEKMTIGSHAITDTSSFIRYVLNIAHISSIIIKQILSRV